MKKNPLSTFYRDCKILRRTAKPSAANGYKAEYETILARIEIEVDLNGIFETLGAKAVANKTGRATEAGGLLVVKASNYRPF